MELAVNLWNENLHWFSAKRAFIEGGVCIPFNGGVDSRVISSVLIWFCVSLYTPSVSACIRDI